MPYVSKAQQRYFHANEKELSKQGVDVGEWDKATDFKHLPEKKTKKFTYVKKFTYTKKS
jgi:hypothetical protein